MLISLFLALMSQKIAPLYTDSAEVITACKPMMWILFAGAFPSLMINLMIGTLRSAADTKFLMLTTFTGAWLVRTPVMYLLCYVLDMGVGGAFWALAIDYTVRTTMYTIRFLRGKWMYRKV